VDAGERLVLIDVIRGFALAGVCISNAYIWFAGRIFMTRDQLRASAVTLADKIVEFAYTFLVSGKFITIFSLLFGLGFAVQLMRAEARQAPIVPLYARRLTVMFALGIAHIFAIWYGDILHLYALLGFVLLLFRNSSERKLLSWGLGLALLAAPLGMALESELPRLWRSPEESKAIMEATSAHFEAMNAAALSDLGGGSYLAVLRQNPKLFWLFFFERPGSLGSHLEIFGKFLLGFYAGRIGLLHDVSRHRRFFRRLLGWGLVVGVTGSAVMLGMRYLTRSGRLSPDSLLPRFILPPAGALGMLGLAVFYVAAIALLFQRDRLRRALSVLAPFGQMAVTNYLLQSVAGVLIFYGVGLGLIAKVGPTVGFAIPLGVVALQIAWSHLWLAHFRFGPVEWVWRSLTYGKAQPMRKPAREAGATAEAPVPASKAP
jgi:uncharacterized protein